MDPLIFKAYDIRGTYPDQINEADAYRIGQGYAKVVNPEKPVVVGCDVRISSPSLKKSVIEGLLDAGVDVIDIGVVSTEMYYFAVGYYNYGGGIQVTASHNPKEWNGAKMVAENVVPISADTGLIEIRNFVNGSELLKGVNKGKLEQRDILDDFCNYVLSWIDVKKIKPLKLVYNPNFGFEGVVLKRLVELASLPLTLIPLNAEPNGLFPKGRPDPYIPENRIELIDLVKTNNADLGVAWDADADRVFFCADGGLFLDPYFTNTLLIQQMLSQNPGAKVVYDPRCTWASIDAIKESGGVPVLERVGHSFIKARMRKENAIFSGENSGHTYYRDFWFADSGMIPLLQILELISSTTQKLSELLKPVMKRYFLSGEINFTVSNTKEIMSKVKDLYKDAMISELDGIACEYPSWRFSLRGSNTEPLLRLNVETKEEYLLQEKIQELTNIITSQ